MSATANVIIIAAIITKVGPSQPAMSGIRPPSACCRVRVVTAITSCSAHELVGQAAAIRGSRARFLWMRTQFLHINRRRIAELVMLEDWLASLSARRVSR